MKDSAAPLSSLSLPARIQRLLEENGIVTVGDLSTRLEGDPNSVLAISGIGPKALLDISAALESVENAPVEQYPEPVQSLGDQFKSISPDEPLAVMESAEGQESEEKEQKKKGKKAEKGKKKKDKDSKKPDKKKKKSKKTGKKKDKKSKKGKGQKAKKK
jgi:hypothetical protein